MTVTTQAPTFYIARDDEFGRDLPAGTGEWEAREVFLGMRHVSPGAWWLMRADESAPKDVVVEECSARNRCEVCRAAAVPAGPVRLLDDDDDLPFNEEREVREWTAGEVAFLRASGVAWFCEAGR